MHTEQGALDMIKTPRVGVMSWFNIETDVNDLNIDVFNSVKKDNNSKLKNDESPYHVSKMNSTESNK